MTAPADPATIQPSRGAAIPFVDLRRQHELLGEELRAAFERVVAEGSFILGPEVERFEEEFAACCGVDECVGVASGTAALTLALIAAGVGAGDEVIVPAHTYIATALAVVHAGAKPVFCDVEDGTGLIDVDSAQSCVTPRTSAVIPVHLYGQMCDMSRVAAFAGRHGLLVLEDAAQAHGARYAGRRAGSFGLAAGFSFYPSKNLGGLGDGGAICTNDPQLAGRARQLRHLGQRGKGEHLMIGFNERLDGLQAALLRVKLAHLDHWNQCRREIAAAYEAALQGEVRLLEEQPESPCVYHLYPVRVAHREVVAEELARAGVACGIHYSPAVHRQPPFASASGPVPELANADRWAAEELSLPIYPGLEPASVRRIAAACLAGVRRAERPGAPTENGASGPSSDRRDVR